MPGADEYYSLACNLKAELEKILETFFIILVEILMTSQQQSVNQTKT